MRWLGAVGVFLVSTFVSFWAYFGFLALLYHGQTVRSHAAFWDRHADLVILSFQLVLVVPPLAGFAAAAFYFHHSDWPRGLDPITMSMRRRIIETRLRSGAAAFRAAYAAYQDDLLDPDIPDALYDAHFAARTPTSLATLELVLEASDVLRLLLDPAVEPHTLARVLTSLAPIVDQPADDPVAILSTLTQIIADATLPIWTRTKQSLQSR